MIAYTGVCLSHDGTLYSYTLFLRKDETWDLYLDDSQTREADGLETLASMASVEPDKDCGLPLEFYSSLGLGA